MNEVRDTAATASVWIGLGGTKMTNFINMTQWYRES
jgi:hypothetical protein